MDKKNTWFKRTFFPWHSKVLDIWERELQDARQKISSDYWNDGSGNVGVDVLQALNWAENCIDEVMQGRLVRRRDLPRLLLALEKSHDEYRREAEDLHGYGSATFHEIRRGISKLVAVEYT